MAAVLIYRSELLAYSETFIAAQARALRRYTPVFAGVRRVSKSLQLPGCSFTLSDSNSLADRARRAAFFATGYAPGLLARIEDQRPSLIHAHFATDAAEALPLARQLGLPMIVTLHGYDVMAQDHVHRRSRRGRLYLKRRPALFQAGSQFLCVSEAIRQKAIERGFPAERLRVHAIGIDLDGFSPLPETVCEPTILFVGRLVEKKGCIHLVRAMAEVRRVIPEARLVILGDGPERARLEEEARRSAPGTLFLGVQAADEVKRWMRSSQVLAMPSITARDGDAEGLPTVLCEGLAMGLPVVCFRSSGIPELVRDGIEGLLSEEGDEAGMAHNLIRLCQQDGLAPAMGRAGRARVEQRFDLAVQTERLEEIYSEIAGASRSPYGEPKPPAGGQRFGPMAGACDREGRA